VLLDSEGRERVAESRLELGRLESGADRSASPAFAGARAQRLYHGDVTFRMGTEPFMTMAVAGASADAGVVVADVSLKHIWDVVSRIHIGDQGIAYVVDRGGRLIAHPDINLVLRGTDLSDLMRVFDAPAGGAAGPRAAAITGTRGQPVLASSMVVAPVGWRVVVEQPQQEADEPLHTALRGALWVAAGSLLLALAAALWSAWRLVRPLRLLAQGAERIGAGQLSHRIELQADGELQQLGERFNAMAAELQASYGSLERQVQVRTRELSEANHAKSRLLAAASHDLRQPLHALNLMVAQQQQQDTDAAEHQRLGLRIGQAIASINTLFDGLLDVSKLDAGVIHPSPQPFAVQQLLDRMDIACSAAARDKGLELRIRPNAGWVHSDPVLLERILGNLVGNAVRYTRRGAVLVGCRRTRAGLRIAVWDTGIGIAPDKLTRIFDEFYRGDEAGAASAEGLGLGLSIVARLADLLGHHVDVRSVPGQGSCFSVTVPEAPARPADVTPAAEPAVAGLHGRRVLVIDNNDGVLDSTAQLLRSWGCQVQALAGLDGPGAVPIIEPELLLLDMHLDNGSNGVALAARLRAQWGRDVPALIMTGDVTLATRERIAAAGLPQLEKPLSPLRLRSALMQLLQRR
jgi:signal transduction histidine kinase/CheY-like chemotaxis protein